MPEAVARANPRTVMQLAYMQIFDLNPRWTPQK